ncbi:hypothetical protein RF11_02841 [Thelohanellus kitauei]|uniref:Uncharacterized protein n=1 Tax=Thelohanellus kitauei TaxID=669202 RepID=A0A0C2J0Y1_THEKT|nr:hypothetical protein RF11_02841 [Thelohanellus kitauei]
MASLCSFGNGDQVSSLTPWLQDQYLKQQVWDLKYKDERYVQILKISWANPDDPREFIVLVTDSSVQIYASIFYKPIDKFHCGFNSIIKLKKYSFKINTMDKYQPPILDIMKFEIMDGARRPIGTPVWIQDKEQCQRHTSLLQVSRNIQDSDRLYINNFPKGLYIPENSSMESARDIESKIYQDFKEFCVCFDRAILSKYFEESSEILDFDCPESQQDIESICQPILNSGEVEDIFGSFFNRENLAQVSLPSSCSDPTSEHFLCLDKSFIGFSHRYFNIPKVDSTHFERICDSIINKKNVTNTN